MAKANLNLHERVELGQAVQRCFALAGLSQKEAAALVQRDPAQIARWIAGAERAPIEVIFAVAILRRPLVIALAELAGEGVSVVTEIRVKTA